MFTDEMENTELTLIDAGISSLLNDVVLFPQLVSLNLHSNYIRTIENLHALKNLQHLDLSSNQIKHIRGLESLQNLKTLNLSSNQIETVQGLTNLHSLTKVNLSYNNIKDLSGFLAICGPAYQLSRVELHGNLISSQKVVIEVFTNCTNLKALTLHAEGASNPVCSTTNYRVNILSSLTQIQQLDGIDRAGNRVVDTGMSDIPGLEDYLAQILPSSSSENMMPINTPKIDAAIGNYKQRGAAVNFSTETSEPSDEKQTSSLKQNDADRLKKIEEQLAQLLSAREKAQESEPTKPKQSKKQAKRDTDLTDESDTTESYSADRQPARPSSKQTTKRKIPDVKLSKTPPNRRALKTKQPTAKAEDENMKQELHRTYQHIVEDLNTERERRYKAEHAAKQLAERVKQLQIETKLGDEKQGVAIEASSRLKEALMKEKEERKRFEKENATLRDDLLDFQTRLEQSKEAHQSTLTAMKSMEESVAKMETEKYQQNSHQTKMIHDAESRAAAAHREIDILRVQIKENKTTVQQLQQLLASREQEHRTELESRYALGSPEIRELLQKEARHVEAVYQNQIANLQGKIDAQNRQYSELEDEFRTALQIEANRFSKVQDNYTRAHEELDRNQQELFALRSKDEKSTQLVAELTQLVKEQKGRIAELAKSKHDQLHDQKDRIQTLEAHLEEARRRLVQFELLKQDNKRIQAQLDAQESIIEGLRAERKLWGQELAQQGSSLAQDRGRLEAKIEALETEISYLKKQLEREVDGVKIKAKLVDDQTETIKHLKDALLERDEQVKTAREESLTVQKKLENQLCDEQQAYRDAQDMIENLTERKQELKAKLQETQDELENERENHSKINNKWKEKADLIGNLEQQVHVMKEQWEAKEKDLVTEKDKALRAANLAIDKMRQMDDAFRKQYESTQRSYQEKIEQLTEEKDLEIQEARARISEVENEMRQLLKEQENAKKIAEERIRRMGQAFTELQQQF